MVDEMKYRVVVGLEIHVQLCTETKMFCGCAVEFGAVSNSRVCPVCMGMPGALPVMNGQAVEFAIAAALALNCKVAEFTKWDRKSYYYPDLPKNYQISQYDLPLGSNGFIEIPLEDGGTKSIRIRRVHLEEDAGKNVHGAGNFSQVDLNRAGTPLLEIVTEPDISSAGEVRALATELQRIVRYLRISQGDMQKAHMRFEPNVNLVISENGAEYKTPIVEIKNLNSFRALERSVEYEVGRQLDEFAETGRVLETGNKSTRGWDDKREVTVLQREKEEAHDYRYFPDPDLVPVQIKRRWLDEISKRVCELPLAKQIRYVEQYGLSPYDAGVLTAERSTAEFFEEVVGKGGDAKRACNIITQDLLKLANEKSCSVVDLRVRADKVAQLCNMVGSGDVSATAATTIVEIMVASPEKGPGEIAKSRDLIQKSDAGELEGIVDEVLRENPQAVADVTSGGKKSKKARGFLLGQVMQKTKGRANPKVAAEILDGRLA